MRLLAMATQSNARMIKSFSQSYLRVKATLFGHEKMVTGGHSRRAASAKYLSSQPAYNEQLPRAFMRRALTEVGRLYEEALEVVTGSSSCGDIGSSLFTDNMAADVGFDHSGDLNKRSPYY